MSDRRSIPGSAAQYRSRIKKTLIAAEQKRISRDSGAIKVLPFQLRTGRQSASAVVDDAEYSNACAAGYSPLSMTAYHKIAKLSRDDRMILKKTVTNQK